MKDGELLFDTPPVAANSTSHPVAWRINTGDATYVTDRPSDASEARAEGWGVDPLTVPRDPLTDAQISTLLSFNEWRDRSLSELVRSVEHAHGITGEAAKPTAARVPLTITEAQWKEIAAITGCDAICPVGQAAILRELGI